MAVSFLPEENLLPHVKGLKPFGCLHNARYGIHGRHRSVGVLLHQARQYTMDRKMFGRPLAPSAIQRSLQHQTRSRCACNGRIGRLKDEGRARAAISLMRAHHCGRRWISRGSPATCWRQWPPDECP